MDLLPLVDVEQWYAPDFRPFTTILDATSWAAKNLKPYRCSAFSEHYSNVEDLLTYVDNLHDLQIRNIEKAFAIFFNLVISRSKVYERKRFDLFAQEIIMISEQLVKDVTQKSASDLFIISEKIIFLGHDDFGFIILSHKDKPVSNFIVESINTSNLYLFDF